MSSQLSLIDAPDEGPRAGDAIASDAVISADGRYRYRLSRSWAPGDRVMLFCMLNPSTADHREDDPTIRRCVGFAKREGCSGLVVVNLYALRATDPKVLFADADPIGVQNDHAIAEAAAAASVIIAAWGASGPKGWEARARRVAEILRQHRPLHCLGQTARGAPRHPLYLHRYAALTAFAEQR